MKFESRAIVIVGESIGPFVVHHELLHALGVVPDTWGEPEERSPIFPELASIKYRNGIVIVGQPGRLQISATPGTNGAIPDTEITSVTRSMLSALTGRPLKAIGVNAILQSPIAEPGKRLAEHFANRSAFPEDVGPLMAFGCTLAFPFGETRVNLSLQPVEDKPPFVHVNANCHTEVASAEKAVEVVERYPIFMKHVEELLRRLLPWEDGHE